MISDDGAIAQLGERYNGIVEVGSSILPGSTNKINELGFKLRVSSLLQVAYGDILGACEPLRPAMSSLERATARSSYILRVSRSERIQPTDDRLKIWYGQPCESSNLSSERQS